MTVFKHQGANCNNSTTLGGICIDNPKGNCQQTDGSQILVPQEYECAIFGIKLKLCQV